MAGKWVPAWSGFDALKHIGGVEALLREKAQQIADEAAMLDPTLTANAFGVEVVNRPRQTVVLVGYTNAAEAETYVLGHEAKHGTLARAMGAAT